MSLIAEIGRSLGETRPDSDILDVIEDDEGVAPAPEPRPSGLACDRVWRLLVVDDDIEVHATTSFALEGVEILGRRLELLHAHSGAEALEMLRSCGADIAVVLLDVVMETDDAGLRAVRAIREVLKLTTLRIILRTGQPGYAPELSVIRDYDINDYRTKSELTRTRLISSLYAALRAYTHLQTLETGRRGLEKIIAASADLFGRRSLVEFCEGILIQLGGLLGMEANGIVLVRQAIAQGEDVETGPVILAAAGPFSHLAGAPLSRLPDDGLKTLLAQSLKQRQTLFGAGATVLHITGPSGDAAAVFLATGQEIGPVDRKLLEVFCTNVAVGFDNIGLIEHVRTQAFFDPLTRLPNRTQFQVEIGKRLERMREKRSAGKLAVVLLDLDHFQMINDGLGHGAGDDVLRKVALRLSAAFEQAGSVSRLTSDLYGILARVDGFEEETDLLDAIAVCFTEPFEIAGNALTVTGSGGYTLVDAAETDVPDAIRRAGTALKRAKRQGRGQIIRFTAAMAEDLRTRLTLVNQLAEATADNQFALHYQPQLRLSDRAVVGVEALLRWRRPDGTFIRPDIFIPAAEDSGHIVSLGEWVLREACLRQADWRRNGLGHLRIAVNVSVRQLRERGFARSVERIVRACDADPAGIELEITESTAMESDRIVSTVQALCDLGFSIAIDDFGTGHSSLSRLRHLPVAMLKIDRSFVDGIESRADSRSIASMIVKMGHELGFSVLAEGVETPAQEAVLREIGCDYVQGFLYARPQHADDLAPWLQARTGLANLTPPQPLHGSALCGAA